MTTREERLLSQYIAVSAKVAAALRRATTHPFDESEHHLIVDGLVDQLEKAAGLLKRARQELLHAPNGQHCVACTIDAFLDSVSRKTAAADVDTAGNIAI